MRQGIRQKLLRMKSRIIKIERKRQKNWLLRQLKRPLFVQQQVIRRARRSGKTYKSSKKKQLRKKGRR